MASRVWSRCRLDSLQLLARGLFHRALAFATLIVARIVARILPSWLRTWGDPDAKQLAQPLDPVTGHDGSGMGDHGDDEEAFGVDELVALASDELRVDVVAALPVGAGPLHGLTIDLTGALIGVREGGRASTGVAACGSAPNWHPGATYGRSGRQAARVDN